MTAEARVLRSATMNDLESIHQLCFDLDYQPSLASVKENLSRLLDHPNYEVIVVEQDSKVVGWMTLHERFRIEDVPFLQVAALVTDKSARGQGIGRSLLKYAETKAAEKKFSFVGLHSSQRRVESHKFYENAGYEKAKASFFFQKDLK